MKKKVEISQPFSIETVSLYQTARQRYLNYALSVITSRALPDVRDGLKPVQRRILYGMQEMHLSHDAKFQKSAQIVGQVMGRYHPHGDSAIYEAMVRLSQPFTMRYPFVDGQGNFGSIDGDGAAHMRYTEARLHSIAQSMLEDLNPNIVDFVPNYSGTLNEPSVLPAAIPNILINGSMGIAVGMATNIPPHNLAECIDACILLIDRPDATLDDIMKCIPGPDFPTAGRIPTPAEEIKKIYESGHGAIDIQGDFHIEQDGKKNNIIITSVPYTVNISKLTEKIGELISSGKLPLLTNVTDESTTDARIVLELKPGADPNAVMAFLFKHTPLQTRFNVNMTCIIPGDAHEPDALTYQPKRLGLRDILSQFLQFRGDIVTKRLQFQLSQLLARIHILEGFVKIFDALETAIQIIRNAEDKPDAAKQLCAVFELDALQADAILEMRLFKLAKLEIDKLTTELNGKQKEAEHINLILSSKKNIYKLVRDELEFAKKSYADERRTQLNGYDLSHAYQAVNYIVDEDCFVIVTKAGLFKRQKSFSDVSSIRTRDNDAVAFVRFGSTRATLVLLSSLGKAYSMLVDNVPATTGHGAPIATIFKLEDGEQIIAAFIDDVRSLCHENRPQAEQNEQNPLLPFVENIPPQPQNERCILAITRQAQISRIPWTLFSQASTANGRIYMRLNDNDSVLYAAVSNDDEGFVSCIANNTRAIVFPLRDVAILKTAGKGMRALTLDPSTSIVAATLALSEYDGVKVKLSDNRDLTISIKRLTRGERGSKGRLLVRRGTVVNIFENSSQNIDTVQDITDPSSPKRS